MATKKYYLIGDGCEVCGAESFASIKSAKEHARTWLEAEFFEVAEVILTSKIEKKLEWE